MKHNKPILQGAVTHNAYPDSRTDGALTNNKVLTTDSNGKQELRTLPSTVLATNAPIYRGADNVDLDSTYHDKTVIMSGEFSQTVTVPLEATESIDIGFKVTIVWRREGDIIIIPEVGVTILQDADEVLRIAKENEGITLIKEATNTWGIFGAIALAVDARTYVTVDDMHVAITPLIDTVLTSISWGGIHKSSDWPEFTFTKDYFLIYSTDHHVIPNGVFWGEMDDLLFTNFVEKGKIIDNGSAYEMCQLFRVPTGESSVTTDEIFLIGHDTQNPAQSFGVNAGQQTRLFTTGGGAEIHLSTWTDRGTPLGYDTNLDPQHTGYMTVNRISANNYVATHFMRTSGNGTDWTVDNPDWWVSTASDPAGPWTHVHAIFNGGLVPTSTDFPQLMGTLQINYKGTDYIVGQDMSGFLGVFDTWDAYLQPMTQVGKSQLIDGWNSWSFYYPSDGGDYVWLITKKGAVTTDFPFRVYKYDLREILG